MREIDLTEATKLKWWLENVGGYRRCEIHGCKDICTLTGMCVKSLFRTLDMVVTGTVLLAILLFLMFMLISGLSYFTLFLPSAYYAPDFLLENSLFTLCVTLLAVAAIGVGYTINRDMEVVPKWMKLSKKNGSDEEKKTSPTILAVKEMYRSVKDKTCIKVKL